MTQRVRWGTASGHRSLDGGADLLGQARRVPSRGQAAPQDQASSRGQAGQPALAEYDVLSPACPSRSVLRHVVDRWTPLVVAVLSDGPQRFTALRGAVGGVSPKVLTQTLRSMERDGLVTRTQSGSVPVRVDYALTELGRTLVVPMGALRDWAQDHAEEVLAHREAYDAAV